VLVPLAFAIAFVIFLWGVIQYFIAGGANEESREKGKQFILYAFIGFVIMVGVWGIVNLLNKSLGFANTSAPSPPCFDGSGCTGGGGGTQDGGGQFGGGIQGHPGQPPPFGS
jgi:hypothetical protein